MSAKFEQIEVRTALGGGYGVWAIRRRVVRQSTAAALTAIDAGARNGERHDGEASPQLDDTRFAASRSDHRIDDFARVCALRASVQT
jgi:hypothetical protein